MEIIDIFAIHFIICYVIDISGFIYEIQERLNISLFKPFNCSACMNMWTVMIYCLIFAKTGLILALFVGCLCSLLASPTSKLMNRIIEWSNR